VRAHAAWQEERLRVRAAGRAPSVRVTIATEYAAASVDTADDVAVESVGGDAARPHGKRFGTLVHAVLAAIDLRADRATVEAVAALQGRILGAPSDEVAAAVESAVRALRHPILVRAAAAAQCRRESHVTLRLDDGELVEGVVDAAFVEDGAWTVVDFKTDVEIAGRLDEYRRQAALYARAIAAATGMPARAVLLRV
jgi:ATP-dependent exoDNAse (exonuclease V) beta subunit